MTIWRDYRGDYELENSDRRAIRVDVCNRADGCCAYCDRKVGMRGTVDHYMPRSRGGTDERVNLRWSCLACNQAKGDMHPEEWERRRPPRRPAESKRATKIRLLALIARRGLEIVNRNRSP